MSKQGMEKSIEAYIIDGVTCYIRAGEFPASGAGTKGFHVLIGGCNVGGNPAILEECRKIIFDHMQNRLKARRTSLELSLNKVKEEQERLGADVRNIGQFRF